VTDVTEPILASPTEDSFRAIQTPTRPIVGRQLLNSAWYCQALLGFWL
jgi:hypothetical protein